MGELQHLEACGLPISYRPRHRAVAEAMATAVEGTLAVVGDRWGLAAPAGARLRVLEDWAEFVDDTAPWGYRWLVRLTRPLWRRRAEAAYALAGGWNLPWRGAPAVGVKPPELLPAEPSALGGRLFVAVDDPMEKVRHLTCHEFTHACTAHLRLPPWLNEGVAMRAVDHLAGRPTVLDASRELAADGLPAADPRAHRRLAEGDHGALLRLYATGYWATRELDEADPAGLADLLSRRRSARALGVEVGRAFTRSCPESRFLRGD